MRKQMLLEGLALFLVGTVLITLGVLTSVREDSVNIENVLDSSEAYGFLANHEYRTKAYLFPGTYELRYQFLSNATVTQFYVSVLDPSDYEVNSVYGPPATYQNDTAQFRFEASRTGQYTVVLGGQWETVQVSLDKLTPVTKIVYPYEIVLYPGLAFFTAGVAMCVLGSLLEEKRAPHWSDNL